MIDDFFRFPHTPHIKWLGQSEPRGDKLLSDEEAAEMLSFSLTVEEKVDGANVGFSVGSDGRLRAQNRGAWIEHDAGGQFKHLWQWARRYESDLVDLLGKDLILFGEWCYAQHSIHYRNLPDWFIGFDIYDHSTNQFYSVDRRNEFLALMGVPIIKPLARGIFSELRLEEFLEKPSSYDAEKLEGVYLRQDESDFLVRRAKLVRSDFTQTIGEHWSRKRIIPNQIFFIE